MQEIRLIQPEDIEAAIRLSDRVFRDAEHRSMGSAYPHVFSPSLGQSYAAFADGKLVSFVGFVPSVVRIGEAELNIYSIGAVCTDPEYRGRGYAASILERIREHSRKAGASLILVSGNRGLYERFGCRRFGDATTFRLRRTEAEPLLHSAGPDLRIRELAPTDWFALKRLAQARPVRFEQSLWDLAALIRAEGRASNGKLRHRVWVAERQGAPTAFAVLAVPGDIAPSGRPALIEWAGAPADAAALVAHGALDGGAETLDVTVPAHESDFAALFARAGCPQQPEKLSGTVAVVDAAALLRQLAPYLERRDAAAVSRLRASQAEDGGFAVDWDGRGYELSADAFISLVFDREPSDAVPEPLRRELGRLFPIPFPLPSGLNFV